MSGWSSDPSSVDSPTLFASLRRDLDMVRTKLWDAAELLREARYTAAELERRAATEDTSERSERAREESK